MIDTISKYSFIIPTTSLNKNVDRLTNQIWKLIPMKENGENWQKQLNTVIIEIAGLNEIFVNVPQFLQLLAKLEGIKVLDLEFNIYRKTIFEIITLLRGLRR